MSDFVSVPLTGVGYKKQLEDHKEDLKSIERYEETFGKIDGGLLVEEYVGYPDGARDLRPDTITRVYRSFGEAKHGLAKRIFSIEKHTKDELEKKDRFCLASEFMNIETYAHMYRSGSLKKAGRVG